jgi:hypothetical protein
MKDIKIRHIARSAVRAPTPLMSCIDAAPPSSRQVTAGSYSTNYGTPHYFGISIHFVLYFLTFCLLGMFNCTLLTASVTQRPLSGGTEHEGLQKLWKEIAVFIPVFS